MSKQRYLVDAGDGARVETHLHGDYVKLVVHVTTQENAHVVLTPDDAVLVATGLVERALLRCSPELREKFNHLLRDMQL